MDNGVNILGGILILIGTASVFYNFYNRFEENWVFTLIGGVIFIIIGFKLLTKKYPPN